MNIESYHLQQQQKLLQFNFDQHVNENNPKMNYQNGNNMIYSNNNGIGETIIPSVNIPPPPQFNQMNNNDVLAAPHPSYMQYNQSPLQPPSFPPQSHTRNLENNPNKPLMPPLPTQTHNNYYNQMQYQSLQQPQQQKRLDPDQMPNPVIMLCIQNV